MTEDMEQCIINLTANAKNDLNNIVSFISQNNHQAAVRTLERIESKINTIDRFPNRGGYVPELLKRNIREYRQLIELPWRIIYRVDENIASILMIVDTRINVQDVLMQRLIK